MPEDSKDLVRRLVQGWQHEHNSEVAEALIAEDFVDRSARPGEAGTKGDGVRFLEYMWGALPDFAVDIKHMIGEGDLVATLKTFSGTHEGEFLGYPPTGRKVTFEVFDLVRVRDGQVTEHWAVMDMDGLKRQLSGG
jgi:steroid delta-isomerase-like uncharacterized protein